MIRITTLTLAAALVAPALFAQGPREGDRRERFQRLQEEMNFSDEQLAALRENNREMLEAVREITSGMRETGDDLKAELGMTAPNPATVGHYVIALHDAREEARATREEYRAEALELLTPEQRTAIENAEGELLRSLAFLNLVEAPDRIRGGSGPPQGWGFRSRPGRGR